jgi:hypothetical protein
VRGVALLKTVTDYRSLAVAERYSQPFGIYAYGLLREFDLPEVASAVGPRRVLLLDAATPLGAPAGAAARDLYSGVTNATVQTTGDQDPLTIVTAWIGGAGA